jgi:4-hydroxyacetophenone monooxygenase
VDLVADALELGVLDEHIRQGAELPVLLMTAAHLTGDYSLLRPEWKPTVVFGKLRCEVPPAERETILRECARRLERFTVQCAEPPRPTFDAIHRIATWAVGKEIEPYIPLLAEEMVMGKDPRRPAWSKDVVSPDRDFSIAIIGGGESGIIAALRLKQAGVPFTLYDKNAELGGTWLENTYPGCRVDINSYVYSYACEPRIWPEYFGRQPDVLEYLQTFAAKHSLYEHAALSSEVKTARWDEETGTWSLTIERDGSSETRCHHSLIYAVGQLNRPALPDISGLADFAGTAFHSARWDHAADLRGKRVGVIGTGASACQFIPKVAEIADSVCVFARTTTWLLPTPELHDFVPASARWLMANLPAYLQWYRSSMLMMQGPGLLDRVTIDPAYPASETAISEANDGLRAAFQNWMEPQIADRADLRDAVIPSSPVGAKRILRDNGTWIRTLKRPNVEAVRTRIERIASEGVVTTDGNLRPLDVLIYGTGFQASGFLAPIEILGRDGRDLHRCWNEDPRTFLGGTVPGFPNMFMIYGPNTNLVVHGGSVILFSELSAKYILGAVLALLETGKKSLDVTEEAFETYNARVDETNARRAWGYSSVNSWYKNKQGRVTQNYPFTISEYWQRTERFDKNDYRFL